MSKRKNDAGDPVTVRAKLPKKPPKPQEFLKKYREHPGIKESKERATFARFALMVGCNTCT